MILMAGLSLVQHPALGQPKLPRPQRTEYFTQRHLATWRTCDRVPTPVVAAATDQRLAGSPRDTCGQAGRQAGGGFYSYPSKNYQYPKTRTSTLHFHKCMLSLYISPGIAYVYYPITIPSTVPGLALHIHGS